MGLRPKEIAEEARFNEVCGAISRFYAAEHPFPAEWILEYNELAERIRKRRECVSDVHDVEKYYTNDD